MRLRPASRRQTAVAPVLAFGLLLGLGAACGGEETADGAPAADREPAASEEPTAAPSAGSAEITAEAHEEARQIFATRCFTCHGKDGRGDGPGSAGLDPQPRDLTDPAWQESVSDEHIERIILYGGAAVGRSPAMPANPDLSSRPAVVAALVEHVRNLPRADAGASPEGGAR